ncbi:hypothetical protein Tco_1051859 [Tanacetum coccineum]
MVYHVASITLDSARSCVMQSAFLTQGTVSNIPIVFSWGDSIRPESFLSSVLLWLVIIVMVIGVGVTVVLVIIFAVVVVVESFSVVKLSFSLRFRGGNPPMKTSSIFSESGTGTQGCQFLESSHICLEIIPLHGQMVKSVFHLLDFSSGTILLYQQLLEFNPGNLVNFFYPNRLGKRIPPG